MNCHILRNTGHAIADTNAHHIGAWPLGLSGCPGEQTAGGNAGARWRAGIEAEGQFLRGDIRIRGGGGKAQQSALIHGLAGNRGQHRRGIHFIDVDRHILGNTGHAIADTNAHHIGARSLSLSWGPGEQTARGDAGARWRAGVEAEGKRLRGDVRIRGGGGKTQQGAFIHGLAGNCTHYRRGIDLIHCNYKSPDGTQHGHAIIRNSDADGECVRTLGLGR